MLVVKLGEPSQTASQIWNHTPLVQARTDFAGGPLSFCCQMHPLLFYYPTVDSNPGRLICSKGNPGLRLPCTLLRSGTNPPLPFFPASREQILHGHPGDPGHLHVAEKAVLLVEELHRQALPAGVHHKSKLPPLFSLT